MRRAMGVALVAAIGVTVWAASGDAAAASASHGVEVSLPAHDTGFTAHPTASLLDVTRMAPGASAHGIMGVRNKTGGVAALTLSVDDVVSSENGCAPAELVFSAGCSADGPGQLRDELVFRLDTAARQHGRYVPRWTGSAADLGHAVDVSSRLAASGTEWVRLSVTLPESAGNQVESDTFGFNLLVVLQGGSGTAGVSVPGSGTEGAQSGPGGLSDTGVTIRLLVLIAESLATAGLWLSVVGRRRRDQAIAS
jgi:hypothetical protein